MFDHYLSVLKDNDVVLTVNQRLSTYLYERYQQLQVQSGLSVWAKPHILPLTTFIENLWHSSQDRALHADNYLLLNKQQSHLLWRQIIEQSDHGQQLLSIEASLQLVEQAWQLINQWQISDEELQQSQQLDQQVFYQWQQLFKQRLQQEHCLSQEQLLNYVTQHCPLAELISASRVYLLGFDQTYPSLDAFIQRLRDLHRQIILPTTQSAELVNPLTLSFSNSDAELRFVANWAKQQYAADSQRIGIVVPDLQQRREEITEIFTDVFCPTKLIDPNDYTPLPFNVSGGKALLEWPLIAIIPTILQLARGTISMDHVSHLLRSPYLAINSKAISLQAMFDQDLRENNHAQFTIKQLQACINTSALLSDEIKKTWLRFFETTQQLQKKKSPQAWADIIQDVLASLAWPGYQTLTTVEYQLNQAWLESLHLFKQLTVVTPRISFQQACYYLTDILSKQHFQIQSKASDIHILGILESSGIDFEQIWLVNLNDQNWPQTAHANPFIDRQLQQAKQMPHASQQRELYFSQQVMQRLRQQCRVLYCSYHQQEDSQEYQPSPLIADFTKINPEALLKQTNAPIIDTIYQQQTFEQCEDNQAPPLLKKQTVQGGSWIITEQASCPFKAFAKFRLNATGISEPKLGFDALQRGLIVHQCLENIWQVIKSSDHLHQLSPADLSQVINNSIDTVINTSVSAIDRKQHQCFLQIEQQRLAQLIHRWLELEKQRPPFTVHATEQENAITLAGLHINIRIDRIDRIDHGNYLLLDYKTGLSRINDWFGERPDAPQLPLYCISSELPIKGLAFAQLRSDNLRFTGLCIDENILPNCLNVDNLSDIDSFDELMAQWQNHLENLASEFINGCATVSPKHGPTTCQYCELSTLCRIHQQENNYG